MLRMPFIKDLGYRSGYGHRFMLVMETHTEVNGEKRAGKIYRADVIIPPDVSSNNALYHAAAMRNGWQKIVDDIIAGRTAMEGADWMQEPHYAVDPIRYKNDAREQRKESLWSRLKKWVGTLTRRKNSGVQSALPTHGMPKMERPPLLTPTPTGTSSTRDGEPRST